MTKKTVFTGSNIFVFPFIWGGVLLFTLTGRAVAAQKVLDNFETYANNTELKTAWLATSGNPLPSRILVATTSHQGSQSMEYNYKVANADYFNSLTLTYSSDQDWSGYTSFTYWVSGLSGNSGEDIHLELQNSSSESIGKDRFKNGVVTPPYPTQTAGWTEHTIDISGWTTRSAVRSVKLFVVAISTINGFGSGKLWFDDFSISGAAESVPSVARQKVFTPNGDGRNDSIVFDALSEPYTIDIYSSSGKRIREITANNESPPFDKASWDGKDENGSTAKNGIYFYRIKSIVGGREKISSGVISVAK